MGETFPKTAISIIHSGLENLKKARPKNLSNEMNQFHGIFFGDIFHFRKVDEYSKKNYVKLIF